MRPTEKYCVSKRNLSDAERLFLHNKEGICKGREKPITNPLTYRRYGGKGTKMFVKTKGMTIEEIVGVEMDYPAVLCKFADGLCDVCYVDYDCNKDGSDVVMKGYPVGHRYVAEHHGAVVEAYEVIFDGTANTLRKWHGQYTDDQEPRKGEMCIILLETSCGNRKRYEIRQAVYREEGFCGYKESTELSVLGFMHIKSNGTLF